MSSGVNQGGSFLVFLLLLYWEHTVQRGTIGTPAPSDPATVFVVDDDSVVRESIGWLVRSISLGAELFGCAAEFLSLGADGRPGCVVSDVRLPDSSGLALLDQVNSRERPLPVILISGHADVPLAVRAMKAGAFDFLEKPFNDQEFLDRVQSAILLDRANRVRWSECEAARSQLVKLTGREREVFVLLVKGLSNKRVAAHLGRSVKTVETHRARVHEKLGRDHLGDLIALATTAGLDCSGPM